MLGGFLSRYVPRVPFQLILMVSMESLAFLCPKTLYLKTLLMIVFHFVNDLNMTDLCEGSGMREQKGYLPALKNVQTCTFFWASMLVFFADNVRRDGSDK